MSVVYIVLTVIGGIIVILLGLALIIPKHYSVTVSEVINKPKKDVYEYVSLLSNQRYYSEWLNADPDLSSEVTGGDGTVGAVLKWESHHKDKNKNVGKGEQEIRKMDHNSIEIELRLLKPLEGTCKLVNTFTDRGATSTLYTCTFYGYAKFPINLPSYLIGRRLIRKTQQQTLDNIKTIAEGLDTGGFSR